MQEPDCEAPLDGRHGHPVSLSDAAVQLSLTIKMPLQQITGMVAIGVMFPDLDWAVLDYTTLICVRRHWPT